MKNLIEKILADHLVGTRNDGSPLWLHSLRVFLLVCEMTDKIEVQLAAAFHDFFEDLKGSRKENEGVTRSIIASNFTCDVERVMQLIEHCSYKAEFADLPKDERKSRQIALWEKCKDSDAILIKIADILDNITNNPTAYYISWALPLLMTLNGETIRQEVIDNEFADVPIRNIVTNKAIYALFNSNNKATCKRVELRRA